MEEPLKTFTLDDTEYRTQFTKKFSGRKNYEAPNPKKLTAFIPGVITKIHVREGQLVKWGESLLILEAMKMRNDVSAPNHGVIKTIHVKEGQQVPRNQLLIEFE